MRYAGRTVVITGAAGGLGSGMAAAFAAEGANVALVDLPGSPGEELAAAHQRGRRQRPGRWRPWPGLLCPM